MLTQDSDAFSTFLDSVPGLQVLRENPESVSPNEHEELQKRILDSVSRCLQDEAKSGKTTWISELAGFNYKNQNGVSDAQFIARLLLDHAIQRPWIIETPFINNITQTLRKCEIESPKPLTCSLCTAHADCDSLPSLAKRHGHVPSTFKESSTARKLVQVGIPHLSTAPPDMQLAFDIDAHLGVSGFNPLGETASQLTTHETSQYQAIDCEPEDISKNLLLQNFRDHVRFDHIQDDSSTHRARITFRPQSSPRRGPSQPSISHDDAPLEKILAMITGTLLRLKHALARCQEEGKCLLGIPFLQRQQEWDNSQGTHEVLLLEIIRVEDFQQFCESFEQLKDIWLRQNDRILDGMAFALGGVALLTAPITLIASFAMGVAVTTHAFYNFDAYRKKYQIQSRAIEALSKSLAIVFQAAGLETSGSDFTKLRLGELRDKGKLIHFISLAVQCMSLAVQSSAQGLCSPTEFSFLEHGVDEFVLEGTDDGLHISATMQPLTCLGDMLGRFVLVFGPSPPSPFCPGARLDLVAPVQSILSVWGPAELGLVCRDGDYGIAEIHIGRGRLRPHREIADTQHLDPPRWHWESDDACNLLHTALGEFETRWRPVDLTTRIRVGVLSANSPIQVLVQHNTLTQNLGEYPGSFSPIGPCWVNHTCPYANETSDGKRRHLMQGNRHLQELGTHRSYSQFAGCDIGAQAGQYVVGQVMWRRDWKPAVVMKDTLLDASQSSVELLRKLDKNCALLVSSCTRLMARARLRDLVALAGPLLYPDLFPRMGTLTPEASVIGIVQALRGNDNFVDWASNQRDASGNILRDQFKDLILSVLHRLRLSGIRPTKDFDIAWISPRDPIAAIRTSCVTNPWLYLLEDGPNTSTFACITPLCLEVTSQTCAAAPCGRPTLCSFSDGLGNFALSTCVLVLPGEHGSGQGQANQQANLTLEVGRRYFLDSTHPSIVAKVCEDGGPQHLPRLTVEVRNTVVGLLRRIIGRNDSRYIRESNADQAIPCLVSGAE